MKALLFAAAALLTTGLAAQDCDQLLSSYNTCAGTNGTALTAYEAQYVDAPDGRPSAGIKGIAYSNTYGVTGFPTTDTADLAKYLEFTVSGVNGTAIQVTGIDIQYSRDQGGPRKFEIRSSVDRFTEVLLRDTSIVTDSSAHDGVEVSEFNAARFAPLEGQTVTFRIYPYAAGAGDYNGVFFLNRFSENSAVALQLKGCPVNSLPVELTGFSASAAADGGADLAWSTASERDNDYFAVEMSLDGRAFAEVARVRGAGTSNEALSYGYGYPAADAGTHYFRLRQVDYDGREAVSKVVAVNLGGGAERGLSLRSNVVRAELDIEVATPRTLYVLGQTGHVVRTVTADAGRSGVAVADLAPGLYVLTDGRTSLRFVK